jgi:UDP-N-acetylglucosamine--N-acetylmuramyl-(pentapeptide) pyrophosphoryl-undecaprenol N-acetylglucosamine transferase
MVLEQNAVPGLTNRLLARVVRAAAVTYDVTRPFFGRKGFVSGNPVRESFLEVGRRRAAMPLDEAPGVHHDGVTRVLIVGGSQGAHAINVAMTEAAPLLARSNVSLAMTHQTGARDLELVRESYRAAGLEARVEPYLYEMDRAMADADIVVSRAGATTLAELAASGCAAIVVPFPFATDDHQRKNAEVLAGAGAAERIDQTDLTGAELATRIVALARDPARRTAMGAAARKFARPDAAAVIVDRAFELAEWAT